MIRSRWTSGDLEVMPFEDGKRYEIIDGELYVSRQPHLNHQRVCNRTGHVLEIWSEESGLGWVYQAPGIIFAEEDDVAPDVVWVSKARLPLIVESDGKFHAAPELIVEVLSPGPVTRKRDREVKLNLYSRRGVLEYWMVDWERKQVEVYRRENAQLAHAATLSEGDTLTSPVLRGFSCRVDSLFFGVGII